MKRLQTLLDAVSAIGTGDPKTMHSYRKAFQVTVSGTWTSTTLVIEASIDGLVWTTIASITSASSGDAWNVETALPVIRADVTAYNATTGDITLKGYEA